MRGLRFLIPRVCACTNPWDSNTSVRSAMSDSNLSAGMMWAGGMLSFNRIANRLVLRYPFQLFRRKLWVHEERDPFRAFSVRWFSDLLPDGSCRNVSLETDPSS